MCFSSPSRLSFVSVVFDFNASLNDVAPASPMLLPADLISIDKSGLLRMPFLCCFLFCFVFTKQIELSEHCVCFQCITH